MSYNAKVYKPDSDNLNVDNGGNINFETGETDTVITSNGTYVLITGLPTSDPSVAGALYISSGALKVSAG